MIYKWLALHAEPLHHVKWWLVWLKPQHKQCDQAKLQPKSTPKGLQPARLVLNSFKKASGVPSVAVTWKPKPGSEVTPKSCVP